MTGMMIKEIGLTFCTLLMLLSWNGPSFAQSPFKDKIVGDWRVYEDLGHLDDKRPKGVPNMAETPALNGRMAKLGIEDCYTYSVYFRIGGLDLAVPSKMSLKFPPRGKSYSARSIMMGRSSQ